ncbi:hypothetical protein EDD17DRAFT_1587544 [Pisolithus thermaeus]|nr:hypothetical protein EDD17DRAFT_1587544 [Pisolithus thermaeus]
MCNEDTILEDQQEAFYSRVPVPDQSQPSAQVFLRHAERLSWRAAFRLSTSAAATMAKPKHASRPGSRSNGLGDCCRACPYLRTLLRDDADADDQRLSPSTSSSAPSPSSAVLSALAFIATSQSSVSGSPLPIPTQPPVFLCPSIEYDYAVPSPPTISPSPPLRLNNRAFTPTPTSQVPPTRRVADRYVKGSDRKWRKTEAWTLYGSTCCSSTSSVNSVPASSSQSSTYTSASATPDAIDVAALPAGWQPSTNTGAEPTIILALAIILAVALFIFIVTCVVWRRKKRKAAKEDPEGKLRHKLRLDDESEYAEKEREARGKMRVWAKATARWKANVRHSARRRRKRQSTIPRGARSHSPTPSEHHEPSAIDSSRCSSPTNAESREDPVEQASVQPDPQTSLPEQSLPPAYRPSATGRSSLTIHHCSTASDLNPSTSRRTSLISDSGSHSSTPCAEPAPYTPPTSGHVSVDDKKELARIGELASAPPEPENIMTGSSRMAVSVPAFDEALEDLDPYPELEPYVAEVSLQLPPSFPSPPSKTTMLKGDAILIVEPNDGELFNASAPPSGDISSLEPSAPSWEDEGDDHLLPSRASSSWRLSSSSAMNAIPPSYHP